MPPRFLTDAELRARFGLSERALLRLRLTRLFPRKDALIGKTDRHLVDLFFDRRSGIVSIRNSVEPQVHDGIENWDEDE